MPDDALDRLHRDLAFKPLSQAWAKVEIFLGLVGVAVGLLGGLRLAVVEARTGQEAFWTAWVGIGTLIVFGAYLALAGHRSHLYQSNNRLIAYLAELIRKQSEKTP